MDKRLFTVIAFEFNNLVKKRVYIILTVVMSVLVFALFFIPGLRSNDDVAVEEPSESVESLPSDDQTIVYLRGDIENEALLIETLSRDLPEYAFVSGAQESEASLLEAISADNDVFGLLTLMPEGEATFSVYQMNMFGSLTARFTDALNRYRALNALTSAGVPTEEAKDALLPVQLSINEIVQEVGKSQTQNYAFTYAVLMLLYMSVIIYGQIVAGSVAAEKGNRTMELLITSTKPLNLLVGKVIGSGLSGLLQLFAILGSALLGYVINSDRMGSLGIGQITAPMVLQSLLFFLLAYFTFAFLFSALGSLVSRTEEVNQTVMAVTLPFVVVFMVAMSALFSPASSFVKTMSFVPFFSPFVMFVRTQMTIVPAWQIAVSVLISLVTLVGSALLSAKIYRLGTLLYGNTVKLSQLPKLLKN